ncbi:MAG TPA: ATP-binding protein [Myxococcota bacterium]|nr:ATP-binding protein [Myxococcota bacterium]
MILQAGVVVPLTLALSARILIRPRNGTLHWLLAALLVTMGAWVAANAVSEAIHGTAWGAGGTLGLLLACPLTLLYLLTMAFHARIAVFESSRGACLAAAVPFALFAVLILTNESHHLVLRAPPTPDRPIAEWAGPGFWAFQLWSYAYLLLGLWFGARGLLPSKPKGERWRAALIVGASALPLLAHSMTLLEWTRLDFPLTPAALGVSALLVVVAIDRYALLESQPIVQRDVIERLHDGVVLTDGDGVVIDLNREGERIFGDRREALRGRNLAATLRELARPGEEEWLLRRLSTVGIEGQEIEFETCDGRRVELRSGALRAFPDRPAGSFLVLRDITAQWKQERMLQQRQRLESVGVLAAGVAHEVNNPLAFVRANLTHLGQLAGVAPKLAEGRADGAGDELLEMGDIVSESLEGLDRIARIVEGLLHFSRPSIEERRPVALRSIAEEALRFAALHRGAPLEVETSFAPDLPFVLASEDRLLQVVLNLLLNARQSLVGRPDARIHVETGREGDTGVLRVRDNGPGVPPAIRDRIFDPFFTTRPPGEGTGLGLAIAFDIVREHAGSLELEPQRAGACFVLRLPLALPG